jgi:hypothetical protein
MLALIPFASTLLSLIPSAIAAGENIAALIEHGQSVLATNADPTDADWQVLRDLEVKLAAQIEGAASANG